MISLQSSIPITVITGFLGSGKTTLLSALLKQKEMTKTAVIINEFGEVGLDHALIERSEENIVELQNGCICCTIRGDLHKTLLNLVEKMSKGKVFSFDRVVIETTGLADPVPIIHTLMTSIDLQRIYTLDGVVTLVDAVNGKNTLDTQPESVKQAALAERIVLTKTDLGDDKTQSSLINQLKAINPAVTIISSNHGDVLVSELFGLGTYDPYNKSRDVKEWLAAEQYDEAKHHDHEHHHHNVNRHGKHIEAFSMVSHRPVSGIAFSFFLDVLAAQMGENLLRVKGIVNIAGENRPAVVHGVQHIFHPVQWLDNWPDDNKSTRLVCITRNAQKGQIEQLFQSLMGVTQSNATSTQVAEAWLEAS
ncbi:MAG: GTP-binding protein [Rickettsiales bacterium]|nr:GTP-binding protein [Rickettsiales bacterium]